MSIDYQLTEEDKFKVCLKIINDKIKGSAKSGSKTANLYEDLVVALESELQTLADIVVFIVTIKYVVQPANLALNNVPSDDKEFCHTTAK